MQNSAPTAAMNPPPNFSSNYGASGPANYFHDVPQHGAHWFQGDMSGFDDDDQDTEHGDNAGDNDGGETRDAKGRRIARACDMCRKKKIKCDGKMPNCSHCENYKTECIFTPVEKKRAPPKGAKYIEGLENRLGRMESLLRLSGLLAEDDGGRTDLGTLEKRLAERQSQPRSTTATPQESQNSGAQNAQTSTEGTPQDQQKSPPAPAPNLTPPEAPKGPKNPFNKDPKEVDALADQMCSLITNKSGETR